jgi:hypothetical protein
MTVCPCLPVTFNEDVAGCQLNHDENHILLVRVFALSPFKTVLILNSRMNLDQVHFELRQDQYRRSTEVDISQGTGSYAKPSYSAAEVFETPTTPHELYGARFLADRYREHKMIQTSVKSLVSSSVRMYCFIFSTKESLCYNVAMLWIRFLLATLMRMNHYVTVPCHSWFCPQSSQSIISPLALELSTRCKSASRPRPDSKSATVSRMGARSLGVQSKCHPQDPCGFGAESEPLLRRDWYTGTYSRMARN